jgi:hypothetical protein
VITPVPGQERDALARDLPDDERITGGPERRIYRNLVSRIEELIEPRSANNADICQVFHGVNLPGTAAPWSAAAGMRAAVNPYLAAAELTDEDFLSPLAVLGDLSPLAVPDDLELLESLPFDALLAGSDPDEPSDDGPLEPLAEPSLLAGTALEPLRLSVR